MAGELNRREQPASWTIANSWQAKSSRMVDELNLCEPLQAKASKVDQWRWGNDDKVRIGDGEMRIGDGEAGFGDDAAGFGDGEDDEAGFGDGEDGEAGFGDGEHFFVRDWEFAMTERILGDWEIESEVVKQNKKGLNWIGF